MKIRFARRELLVGVWALACLPGIGSAAEASKAPSAPQAVAAPASRYEVIPLDPAKQATPDKDVHPEILEQKGLGVPVWPDQSQAKRLETERTLKVLCKELEGKVMAYVGEMALVEGCKQRPISDLSLLNEYVLHSSVKVVDVPAHVYREVPRGAPLTSGDLKARVDRLRQESPDNRRRDLCERHNGGYLTVSGDEFYYVDKCKKRAFRSYGELVEHNTEGKLVSVMMPDEAARIPTGEPMSFKSKEENALLYKLDGDVVWSRIYGGGKVDRESEDNYEKLAKIQAEKVKAIDRGELCRSLDGRVVSFFSKIYFMEKCERRPVLTLSLELQQALADGKGIVDLTSDQYRATPEGKTIEPEQVLARIK